MSIEWAPGGGSRPRSGARVRRRARLSRNREQSHVVALGGGGAVQALSRPEKHGHTAPRMELSVRIERWPIAGAFAISRGRKTEAVVVVAELNDGIHRGRGESVPYARYGETPDGIVANIEALRPALRQGLDREALQTALGPGAARNALDCAYWDVNARRTGRRAHDLAGLSTPKPLTTAYTISLGSPAEMAAAAERAAWRPLLKIKLGGGDDRERIAAVRGAAPRAE